MQIAERLYTQGYISYPRTETTQYPTNFDFKEVLQQQTRSVSWGELVKSLLKGDMQQPRKGVVRILRFLRLKSIEKRHPSYYIVLMNLNL